MNTLKQTILFKCIFLVFFISNITLHAQDNTGHINYQAILRGSNGNPLPTENIKIKFSIYSADTRNELIWQEEHNATTSPQGLFVLKIGSQPKISGSAPSFDEINWGKSYNLRVDISVKGGAFEHFGTNPLVSVPYALYAKKAGSATPDFSKFTFDAASNTLKNDGSVVANLTSLSQSLQYDPTSYHLTITGQPGIVDLRQFAHAPQDLRILNNKVWITGNKDSTVVDLSPYKQTLSVSATSKLQISGGNEVQVDTSNTNEIQTLSLLNNKISLSRGGGEVTIDASETNELQTLSKVNNALVLSNAPNGRAIPIDTSLINEIQTIQRTGNKLSLSGTTTEVIVDDADADATNELITGINYNQNTRVLTIQEGTNSITANLSSQKVAFRAIKTTNTPFASGASSTIVFTDEKMDLGNCYDALTGIFTVPANGAGVYCFFFTVETAAAEFTYELLKNNQNPEILLPFNQPILLDLQENDNIKIRATASDVSTLRKASFIGYKVN